MARYSEVLIPDTQPYRLENASIPRVCIAGAPGNAVADSEGCLRVDLVIDDGRVAALAPVRGPRHGRYTAPGGPGDG